MNCLHQWHTIGTGKDGRVFCALCNRHATVTLDPTPKDHLDTAREHYDEALKGMRGTPTYLASLEMAVGNLICHLEGKRGR